MKGLARRIQPWSYPGVRLKRHVCALNVIHDDSREPLGRFGSPTALVCFMDGQALLSSSRAFCAPQANANSQITGKGAVFAVNPVRVFRYHC